MSWGGGALVGRESLQMYIDIDFSNVTSIKNKKVLVSLSSGISSVLCILSVSVRRDKIQDSLKVFSGKLLLHSTVIETMSMSYPSPLTIASSGISEDSHCHFHLITSGSKLNSFYQQDYFYLQVI